MKRWLSVLLVMTLLMSLCMPVVHATPIEQRIYTTPTNVAWGDDGEMIWESEYLTNKPDNFRGFQVIVQYTADDVNTVENPTWEELYGYEIFTSYPSLGDFPISANGYYRFAVVAYGEYDDWDTGYFYTYVSELSAWSEPMYFEIAPKLPAPSDLKWEGSSMQWSVDNITNVVGFQIYICREEEDGSEYVVTSRYVTSKRNQTSYSVDIEEAGLDEEWLLKQGSQNYYFKVYSVSNDALVATNSDWTTCETTLNFNAAAEKLSAPTGLYWDGYAMKWDAEEGSVYDVTLYFQRTELTPEEEAELEASGGSSAEIFTPWEIETYTGITGDDDWPALNNLVLYDRVGNYWFQVRARSTDLSQYLSSDWSENSAEKAMSGRIRLDAPTNLTWQKDTGAISWSWDVSADQQAVFSGVNLKVFYKAATDDEAVELGQVSQYEIGTGITEWKRLAKDDGYYSVQVQVLSEYYDLFQHSDWSVCSEDFYYDAPDPLPAPADLVWVGSRATWTNMASADAVNRNYITLYYYGADGTGSEVFVFNRSLKNTQSSYIFREEDFARKGAGVYRFAVYASAADTDAATNSESIISGTYTYAPAETALTAPTGLRWEEETMVWDVPTDTTGIAAYEVWYGGSSNRYYQEVYEINTFPTMETGEIEHLGSNITFRVRAVSADVSQLKDSEWTDSTTAYEPPEGLPAPTDPMWSGDTMTWSWDGDISQLQRFEIQIYYAANAQSTPELCGTVYARSSGVQRNVWSSYISDEGIYNFCVRALSYTPMALPNSEFSSISAGYTYQPAPKLAAPTGLAWDGSVITWTIPDEASQSYLDSYEFNLYLAGRNEYIYSGNCSPYSGRVPIPSSIFEQNGPGTYTFTMRARTWDSTQASNSDAIAGQGSFVYSRPTSPIAAPQNLRWEGTTAKWDPVAGDDVGGYQVIIYNGTQTRSYTYNLLPGDYPRLSNAQLNNLGSDIKFRVKTITGNASNYADSDWAVCTSSYTPADPMPVPYDLKWSEGTALWSWTPETDEQADALDTYTFQLFYGETADAEPTFVGVVGVRSAGYQQWTSMATKSGWYYFRVSANSGLASIPSSDWSVMSAGYQYTRPEPVAPPTNLRWDLSSICWDASASGVEKTKQYKLTLYYYDPDTGIEQRIAIRYVFNAQNKKTLSYAFPTSCFQEMGSGSYRISIVANSVNASVNSNSDPVWSDVFIYTEPNLTLDVPGNLHWDGAVAKWDLPEDTSNIAFYDVVFFAADDPNNGYSEEVEPGTFPVVDSWYVFMLGESIGFHVSAVSNDANTANDSGVATCETYFAYDPVALQAPQNLKFDKQSGKLSWDAVENADRYFISSWYRESENEEWVLYASYVAEGSTSKVIFLQEEGQYQLRVYASADSANLSDSENGVIDYTYQLKAATVINSDLSQAISGKSAQEAVAAIKEDVDSRSLASAMMAVQSESNTTLEQIRELEEAIDVTSEVSVSEETEKLFAEDFDSQSIEVVGAALSADSGTVTLSIQETETAPVVDQEKYMESVSFSMHLLDEQQEVVELSAPVWVKLPVPEGLNPALLRVLHCREDAVEVLLPTVTKEADQWYMAFAVTSFSDFVIADVALDATVETGNKVLFEANFAVDLNGIAICAVYDKDGKVIGVDTIGSLQGYQSKNVAYNGTPHTAKMFLVNGTGYNPLYSVRSRVLD